MKFELNEIIDCCSSFIYLISLYSLILFFYLFTDLVSADVCLDSDINVKEAVPIKLLLPIY